MALQQSDELREVFLRYYQALATGDPARVLSFQSREEGTLGIGTDPDEWWGDYATLERIITVQVREIQEAGVRLEPGDVQCYQEGNIGWGADQGVFVLPDGTRQPFRITAVFRREGADWKMVQFHTSIGVRNQEVIGTDLTT